MNPEKGVIFQTETIIKVEDVDIKEENCAEDYYDAQTVSHFNESEDKDLVSKRNICIIIITKFWMLKLIN